MSEFFKTDKLMPRSTTGQMKIPSVNTTFHLGTPTVGVGGRKARNQDQYVRQSPFPPGTNVNLIIDGSNMFIRNCSIPNLAVLANSKGQKTGGLFGTLRSVLMEAKRFHPSAIYFVSDRQGSARRKALFPEYKCSRRSTTGIIGGEYTPEERSEYEARTRQLEVLKDLLSAIGVRVITIPGLEADDIIAHLTTLLPNCVIVSSDTDFIQLVDEVSVFCYNPLTKRYRNHRDVGVAGPAYAVLKSIVGDTSDDIPGIPRMGWKTVTKWCNGDCPQTLEDLKVYLESHPSKISTKVSDNWELVERNFQLISLSKEVLDIPPELQLKILVESKSPGKGRLMDAVRIVKQEELGPDVVGDIVIFLKKFCQTQPA